MPDGYYGIVVEGAYDQGVYEELIGRVATGVRQVVPRVMHGVSNLRKRFPVMLEDLQERPVDKALVICDSNGDDPEAVEASLLATLADRNFSFTRGAHVIVVRRNMETWLLADPEAINRVAWNRMGRTRSAINPVREDLEEHPRPKEELKRLLSQVGLPYDPMVCREIARRINLGRLDRRCPSFGRFRRRVIDC